MGRPAGARDRDWAEIAARLRSTAEACRKQLARAIDRVEHPLEGSEIGDD